MVFKTIARIKAALPEVIHIIMFYNNGTIFQTTFEQDINIPKLGESLAKFLNKARKINEICKFKPDDYKKILLEMEEETIILIKLGEESNIALIFKNEDSREINLTPIKRYLTRIEELIDMDKNELILKQILAKEEESKTLESQLKVKREELDLLNEKIINVYDESDRDKLRKEYNLIEQEWHKLEDEDDKIKKEINILKNEIEKTQRK
ncbi:MAG: hypothetical protein P8Y23_07335 [Candidatus Lokiarchaeota archaeon]|jgi:predicted regulator of Ras-like GTPase activity (Roadblock/LC7/MglB family)